MSNAFHSSLHFLGCPVVATSQELAVLVTGGAQAGAVSGGAARRVTTVHRICKFLLAEENSNCSLQAPNKFIFPIPLLLIRSQIN